MSSLYSPAIINYQISTLYLGTTPSLKHDGQNAQEKNGIAEYIVGERETTYSSIPATKPAIARRPPARALAATAPLDFDDEVDEGALPVADPVLELDDPEPVELEELGGVPSADDALAVVWNASKDLFAVGLTAKTMPCSQ
jgi:hypothetical protein